MDFLDENYFQNKLIVVFVTSHLEQTSFHQLICLIHSSDSGNLFLAFDYSSDLILHVFCFLYVEHNFTPLWLELSWTYSFISLQQKITITILSILQVLLKYLINGGFEVKLIPYLTTTSSSYFLRDVFGYNWFQFSLQLLVQEMNLVAMVKLGK